MSAVRIEVIVGLLVAFGLGLQWWARSATREAGRIATGKLPTATAAARRVLDGAGLTHVAIVDAERRRLDPFGGERVMLRTGAVRLVTADVDRKTLAAVVGAARLATRAALLRSLPIRLLWWLARAIGRVAGVVAVSCAVLLLVGVGGRPLREIATVALALALTGFLVGAGTELAARRRLRTTLPQLIPSMLARDAMRLALVSAAGASAGAILPATPTPRWPMILPGATGSGHGIDGGAGGWDGIGGVGDGGGHSGGHGGCGGGGCGGGGH